MIKAWHSASLWGIDAQPVAVEVDCSPGLPGFSLVGMPDTAVREARERVLAALRNSGFSIPNRKTTVNLAPADRRKEGSAFDLPIALGVLLSSGQLDLQRGKEWMFLGELALDGKIRPVTGALSVALLVRKRKLGALVLPLENCEEASMVQGVEVHAVESLADCVSLLSDTDNRQAFQGGRQTALPTAHSIIPDFEDVRGQLAVRRALEVAAAGGHNFLMVGPPGSGKSLSARRLPGILPVMNREESLEATRIHSAAGLLRRRGSMVQERPFRCPHHTASAVSMAGGGNWPRPGEVSLAHNGLLFLDELPEFGKQVLEVLRQPLEDGSITVSRTMASLEFPCRFMLGAAMNPCPCGYLGDLHHSCSCTPLEIRRYLNRLSGPLLDRIDLHIDVPALDSRELSRMPPGEPSAKIAIRVHKARLVQRKRLESFLGMHCNAHMGRKQLEKFCVLDADSTRLMEKAVERLGLSARAWDRLLKLSRTIADLDGSADICSVHVAESLQYRGLDRREHFQRM